LAQVLRETPARDLGEPVFQVGWCTGVHGVWSSLYRGRKRVRSLSTP
jgi:hypothetical protein